jgi:hypothetical protein
VVPDDVAALGAFQRKRDAASAVEMLLSMGEVHSVPPDACSYATALATCRTADRFDLTLCATAIRMAPAVPAAELQAPFELRACAAAELCRC